MRPLDGGRKMSAGESDSLLKGEDRGDEEASDVEDARDKTRPHVSSTEFGRKGLLAALLYGSTSIAITFFNKAVFFVWHFDYAVTISLLQVTMSLLFFRVLGSSGALQLPTLTVPIARQAMPLAVFWCLNVLSGIFTLEFMSIPMFSTLRRLTTVVVLAGEHVILRKYASQRVWVSVGLMTVGALIAGAGDLDFNPAGYACVTINNLCTAAYLLLIQVTKSNLQVSNLQLLFLMNACSFPFLLAAAGLLEASSVAVYPHLWDPMFLLILFCSCAQAFVLNYATFLCTTLNSGVTTSITGQMSKLVTMTLGLFLFVNTTYTYTNLVGLGIGLLASFLYTYVKFQESNNRQ